MSSHFASAHFGAAHYESSHYGRGVVIVPPPDFTPEPTFPPGMGTADMRRWIQEEDDLLMLIIRAFLHIKDDE